MKKNFQSKASTIISDFNNETPNRQLLISSNNIDRFHTDEIMNDFQVVSILILLSILGGLLLGISVYNFFFEFIYSLKLGLIHGSLCAFVSIINFYIRK